MIGFLQGKLIDITTDSILLDVHGIGFEVAVPTRALQAMPAIGQTVKLYTWLQVSTNELRLYGFPARQEMELFKTLLSVSGIGPRTAVGILGAITAPEFIRAVQQQQFDVLTRLPGIGKKTAERLVLELRDKLADVQTGEGDKHQPHAAGGALGDAVEALVVLGYSSREAEQMVQGAYSQLGDDSDVQALLKLALANSIAQKGERAWRRNEW